MAKSNTYDASSISVLEGLEAVRKRPGMYIGSVSQKRTATILFTRSWTMQWMSIWPATVTEIEVTSRKGRFVPQYRITGGVFRSACTQKGCPAERLVFTTLHAGGKV